MKKLVRVEASYKAAERSFRQLREDRAAAIGAAVEAGNTKTAIAEVLGVHPSRVYQIIGATPSTEGR